jgi:hypothetical protein
MLSVSLYLVDLPQRLDSGWLLRPVSAQVSLFRGHHPIHPEILSLLGQVQDVGFGFPQKVLHGIELEPVTETNSASPLQIHHEPTKNLAFFAFATDVESIFGPPKG